MADAIKGRVIDARTRKPLEGVRVEAWSDHPSARQSLGRTNTDAKGTFAMEVDARKRGAYVRVFRGDIELTTRGRVLWDPRRGGSGIIVGVDGDVPKEPEQTYEVSGVVTTERGVPLDGLRVEVWDHRIDGLELVGIGTTDAKGGYLVHYDEQALGGKTSADLEVRVIDPRRDAAEVARSEVAYNVEPDGVFNLAVPEANVSRGAEFERVRAAIHAKAGDYPVTKLQAGGVKFLAGATGWDPRAVGMVARAEQLAADSGIAAEHHYALLRSGLPDEPSRLYGLAPEAVRGRLEAATKSGLIGQDTPIEATLKAYQAASDEFLPKSVAVGAVSSLGEMLDLRLDAEAKARFLSIYRDKGTDADALWGSLAEAGFDGKTIDRLRVDGQLGHLTLHNAPVVGRLVGSHGIEQASDLARRGFYRAEIWTDVIANDAPEGIDADSYAAGLAAQVALAYPTLVTATMIRRGELARDGADDEVSTFLERAEGKHTIGVDPVKGWDGFAELTDGAKRRTLAVERMYQMSPSNDAMASLDRSGLDSAYQITRYSRGQFLDKYAEDFSSGAEAGLVYDKAQQVHGTTLGVATAFLTHQAAPNVYALTGYQAKAKLDIPEEIAGAPTLEELFQNMDYCACEHCKSVLSPAAYLVELLEFLDASDTVYDKENPIEVLLRRRPDIQHIQLSCENTNVVLPYVDIVNEVLEHFVVHGNLDEFTGHDMSTESDSADLLADPQFVEATAYDETKSKMYPHILPFDMPLAALRGYFREWDTTLAEALQSLGDPAHARRERLGLSAEELSILTDLGFRDLPVYFGEPAGASIADLNDAVANGKIFARRMEIDYEDLVALLRTELINPGAPLVPRLARLDVSMAQLGAWFEGSIADDALTDLLADDLDLGEYDGDVLAWLTANRDAILGLIVLTDIGEEPAPCDFAEVELRFANPDPATNRLDALAYVKLHRFIRLWKKLGYDILLTAELVRTFLPLASGDVELGNVDAAFSTLLGRLAGFMRLLEEQSISRKRIPDWLALWEPGVAELVRSQRLARLLRMSLAEVEELAALTGIDPLAKDLDADEPSILRLLSARSGLERASVPIADLAFILRHHDPDDALAPTEATLLASLSSIRSAIASVDASLDLSADAADVSAMASRMALVYDTSVVDWFFGLLSGTRSYEAELAVATESLPDAIVSLDERLVFDAFRRRLRRAGALSGADVAALHAAADALTVADVASVETPAALADFVAKLKAAVVTLHDAAVADLQALEAAYPELGALHGALSAEADSTQHAAMLLEALLPSLRSQLRTTAIRSALEGTLKLEPSLLEVVTGDAAVLESTSVADTPVVEDFVALVGTVVIAADGVHELYLDPPASDDYRLYVAAAPGTNVTLELDGDAVIPATAAPAGGEVSTPDTVSLVAGALVPIRLTVAGLPAAQQVELRWRTQGMAKQQVPTARLMPAASVAAARNSLARLHGAAMLLGLLPQTAAELRYFAAEDPLTRGFVDALPTGAPVPEADVHAQWERVSWLLWFSELRADEPEPDKWVGLLADPTVDNPTGGSVVASVAGWKDEDLAAVLAHYGHVRADLSDLAVLRRVRSALELVARTQQRAEDLVAWTVAGPDTAVVDGLEDSIRGRLDPTPARELLQRVNDTLRNQRRDALVAYILHHQPPAAGVETPDALYEYFLIDVQMDACMRTSRIKQALSTVQLFVTRCLMNLEPAVAAATIREDHWQWMKRYRVWEANRKVFLYPENWLEPELRPDKSFMFRELESALLKADITNDLAETAYLDYLKKLDEIARLEIVGSCVEEQAAGQPEDDILHVFGRTMGTTREYYYRRFEYGYWTPWEKVSLAIEGDNILPVVWRRQLFVFWVVAVVKPAGAAEDSPEGLAEDDWTNSAKVDAELTLAWGEYFQGKWMSPKSTEMDSPIRISGLREFRPSQLVLCARTEQPANVSERLILHLLHFEDGQMYTVEFTSKNSPPVVESDADLSLWLSVELFNYRLLWAPEAAAKLAYNSLQATDKDWKVRVAQPDGAAADWVTYTLLTKKGALRPRFRIRTVMQPLENQWEAPLFYADEHSVFFVRPDETLTSVYLYGGYYWKDQEVLVDIPDIPPLYERPIIDDPLGPYVDPMDPLVNPRTDVVLGDDKPFVFDGELLNAGDIKRGGFQ